jgi:hypothetical protein
MKAYYPLLVQQEQQMQRAQLVPRAQLVQVGPQMKIHLAWLLQLSEQEQVQQVSLMVVV